MALPAWASDALAAETGKYPSHPKWRFVFVNHVTTNPFFVPTRYGAEDAGTMTNTTYQWTGSETAKTPEMINAMNAAISGKADGIAVCVVDPHAFDSVTVKALKKGIPVVAYNADGSTENKRLAYIGQDLFNSGVEMGKRIATMVPKGGRIGLFIATPGPVQHPAAHRRRAVGAEGQGLQDRRDHDRRRPARRALEDRRLRAGPSRTSRACSPWTPARPRASAQTMQKRGAAGQGRQGRRLRPAADHARPDQERRSWTSRSTSSRTCRASSPSSSCSCTRSPAGSWRRRTRTRGSCS